MTTLTPDTRDWCDPHGLKRRAFQAQAIDHRCNPLEVADLVTEDDALAWARERCTSAVQQVTITGRSGDAGTWAVRHLKPGRLEVEDSGWRVWVDGMFVGGGEVWPLPASTLADHRARLARLVVAS